MFIIKKNLLFLWLLTLLAALISGCTEQVPPETKIIATINGYKLTLDEYESKLVRDMEYNLQYKTTKEARKIFLEGLIQKELLIQESVNLGLDKKQAFIEAIEKYWEATLIKNLIELKTKEIKQTTFVTNKEIQNRYMKLKQANKKIPAYSQAEKDIAKILKEAKQTNQLNQWMNSLKNKADVKIFKQNF